MKPARCEMCGIPFRSRQSRRWKTWNRFCSRTCCGKHLARYSAERTTHEQRSQWAREAAKVARMIYRDRLLDGLRHLDRNAAIWKAYQIGRHTSKNARLQAVWRQEPERRSA